MKVTRFSFKPLGSLALFLQGIFSSLPWSTLLVMALILVSGIFIGYAVSRQSYLIAVVAIAAVPVGIFLLNQPFDVIIIWLLVAPFFVTTDNTINRMAYWVTHRTMIPLTAIVTLVVRLTQKNLRFDRIDFFIFIYLLINIISVLYYYPDNPLPQLYEVYDRVLVGVALFWLLRTLAPNEVQMKRLVVTLLFVLLMQGCVGIMQNIPATRAVLPRRWLTLAGINRTNGTFQGITQFGAVLITSMLLTAHYAFHVDERRIRILCLVGALLGGICIVLSFSRGTWLASAITLALAFQFYPRTRRYILALASTLVLILSVSLFADSMAWASERFGSRGTVDSRLISNFAHLRMIQAKPLLGWGHDNYVHYHMPFVRAVAGVAVTDPEISSHNTFLSLTVELGLVGLVAFLMPWWLLFKESVAIYKRLPQKGFYSRYLLVVLWLGVAFFSVAGQSTNWRVTVWGMTWMQFPLGLIAGVVSHATRQNQESALDVDSQSEP